MIKIFSSPEEAAKAIPEGSVRLLIINGKKIAIAHTDDGFLAFANECPHQNEPLHKGRLTANNEVVCRLHHYQYNMKTGKEINNRCEPMNVYPVNITESGVFIEI